MCNWCEENDGQPNYCQDCGCMICWDVEGEGDDIMRRPYVTASGDVFCSYHGRQYDEAEEEYYDDLDFGWDIYNHSWYDPSAPDLADGEDSTGRYIGE